MRCRERNHLVGLKKGKMIPWCLVCEPGEQRRSCVRGDFEWDSNRGRGGDLSVRGLRMFRNETEIDVFAGISCIHPIICELF